MSRCPIAAYSLRAGNPGKQDSRPGRKEDFWSRLSCSSGQVTTGRSCSPRQGRSSASAAGGTGDLRGWPWSILAIHEQEQSPLVCTIRRRFTFAARREVRDAEGELVGVLAGQWIRNRWERAVIRLEALGGRSCPPRYQRAVAGAVLGEQGRPLLEFLPGVQHDPFAKMMLLAAVVVGKARPARRSRPASPSLPSGTTLVADLAARTGRPAAGGCRNATVAPGVRPSVCQRRSRSGLSSCTSRMTTRWPGPELVQRLQVAARELARRASGSGGRAGPPAARPGGRRWPAPAAARWRAPAPRPRRPPRSSPAPARASGTARPAGAGG